MKSRFLYLMVIVLSCSFFCQDCYGEGTFNFGRFGDITLYLPKGEIKSVIIYVSGDGGWNQDVINMALPLTQWGAVVAGIDITHYLKALKEDTGDCYDLAGEFQDMAVLLERKLKLTHYIKPVLVGYSSGATLVYGLLGQAPAGSFAGAISFGFCPDLPLDKTFCSGDSGSINQSPEGNDVNKHFLPLTLADRWFVLEGVNDQACDSTTVGKFVKENKNSTYISVADTDHFFWVQDKWLPQFRDAFTQLTGKLDQDLNLLKDFPIIEVKSAKSSNDIFAVLLTGDGGWAGLDKQVAKGLSERGISVVGLDSLRYFWKKRTPESTAKDVGEIINYYSDLYQKKKVVLIGYSLGADIIPFVVNRLSPDSKEKIDQIVMIGLGKTVSFEFHLTDWFGFSPKSSLEILPELKKMDVSHLRCIYGEKEGDSVCPQIPAGQSIMIPGGHHYDGNYQFIVDKIFSK